MALLKKRKLILLTVVILVAAVVLSLFVFINFQKPYSGNIESISLGVYPSEYTSLIYIAKDQQYFSMNGLDVTLKNYPSGSAAVRGMLNGEVDIATASEYVLANNVMNNASLYALGTVSKYLNVYMAVRLDKGINTPSDLVGKTIGVAIGTSNQFFLGRYLEINQINQSQVKVVNLNFAETPNAIANGTVDAAVVNPPYTNEIKSLLGSNTAVWSIQSNQFGFFESISTQNWVMAKQDLIVRFLKALIQAENFNVNHQDQAIALVAKNLNLNNSEAASYWQDYQYSVSLDQSFVLLMQAEARWLISNSLTEATSVPDFLNYIYANGLKSVDPQSVNLVGLE